MACSSFNNPLCLPQKNKNNPFFPFTNFIMVLYFSSRTETENQQVERAQQVRRAPSFSGPLMLPNRASANSLSAPIKPSSGKFFVCLLQIHLFNSPLVHKQLNESCLYFRI